ncbi:MAG: type II toxin-antitoxin system Phd/YefM family antitoxin [Synergistaceae bacterium]|jgi:antitoxin YefM|nr:type II toxin-antitoxin system Phd/YefM family antitoxin [Synergistaceae bacterium]
MISVKTKDLRYGLSRLSDLVRGGEAVLVSRPHNLNLVLISESAYNEMEKARRNMEYLEKIDRSIGEAERGETVEYSLDELSELIGE